MNDKYWINLISNRLEKFAWNGDVGMCRCPICGDSHKSMSKKRFYFFTKDRSKYRVFCHNCNYSASLYAFLKKMYPDVAKQYALDLFTEKEHSEKSTESIPPNVTGYTPWDFSSCIHIDNIPEDHFVHKYVKSRKIPFENVLYCPNVNKILVKSEQIKDPAPSLLIPYRRRNAPTEVFQIRFFDSKRKPKYLTFKHREEAEKVWNLDFVRPLERVFVTEGPIDAMMIQNAIAVGGSNLTIAEQYVPHPVLIYDNEPRAPIICEKLHSAIKQGFDVVIFPREIEEKDLNDMAKRGINVNKLVNDNVYGGLNAELVFHSWRRC